MSSFSARAPEGLFCSNIWALIISKSRRWFPVNQSYVPFEDLKTCRLGEARKALEPCSIIIFGASGDLTARKLIPALYHLCKDKQLPPDYRIIGFARREKTDASWRDELRSELEQFSRTKPIDEATWKSFAEHIFYCRGDMTEAEAYKALATRLDSFGSPPLRHNLLFYLATMPSQFGEVV